MSSSCILNREHTESRAGKRFSLHIYNNFFKQQKIFTKKNPKHFATFIIVLHYYCVWTLKDSNTLVVIFHKFISKNYYCTVSWEKAVSSADLSCGCKILNSVFQSVQVLISHWLPDLYHAVWLNSVTCCLLASHVSPGNTYVHSSINWI